MRRINSWTSFKTCYIASVKEEMGLPVRRAWNREKEERKVKVPENLKSYIKKAIEILGKEKKQTSTYAEIQKKAFELYRENMDRIKAKKFKGIFSDDPTLIKEVAEDKAIFYEA